MQADVAWSGEIDYVRYGELRAELLESLNDPGVTSIVIDLSGVTFIDSMGISLLVQTRHDAQDRGRTLAIRSPSPPVTKVFGLTGVTDLFDVV